MRCARLSQYLLSKGIEAHFNLQADDYDSLSKRIKIDTTRWELAEFGGGDRTPTRNESRFAAAARGAVAFA